MSYVHGTWYSRYGRGCTCRRCVEGAREAGRAMYAKQSDVGNYEPPATKDEAPCCLSKRDDHGRLPIGYCGPDCERRPEPLVCTCSEPTSGRYGGCGTCHRLRLPDGAA